MDKGVQTAGELTLASDGLPVLAQAWLLDGDALPHRPDLLPKVKAFVHTGKIVDKDDELVARACEALVLNQSIRQIARDNNVSRNTVARWREELETAGKLEPLKQRISKKLGRMIEGCLDSLTDKTERGLLPANIEAIAMGIGIDKKGQIDAGVVPGTELREEGLDAETLRRQWAEMKRAKVIDLPPTETQSVGKPANPQ